MDKFILVDLETQSFEVESGIYEVACLVIENYEIRDQLYLGKEIDGYQGEKIFGFGFHDISSDLEYIKKFNELLNKYPYPLVAHNCPFDRKFLIFYEWITEDYPVYCSMRAIRIADKSLSSYSLKSLVNYYKVAEYVEHTAMSDIMNLYKILSIIKPQEWIQVGVRTRYLYGNKTKARKLEDIDLNIDSTNILAGETVCFTGTSIYTRNTMQEIAIKNGAEISDNITSKTTLLIVGTDAGSKLDKAQEKGISIISDEDFMRLLNLKNKQINASVHSNISTAIEIKERGSKFLPQSVSLKIEKKWFEYEPEFWLNSEGKIDADGIEWKPLWILEKFKEAKGYYISRDYRLKKPNKSVVPMQKSILGKLFYPIDYAYLFLVEEYNKYFIDFKHVYVYEKDYCPTESNRVQFEYCCFIMWDWDMRISVTSGH